MSRYGTAKLKGAVHALRASKTFSVQSSVVVAAPENRISTIANEASRLVQTIALSLMTDPVLYILVPSCHTILTSILYCTDGYPVSRERLADKCSAGAKSGMMPG